MNNFESMPIGKKDESKKTFADGLSRKVKQLIVGASLLGATSQAIEGSELKHETQKVSSDVNVEMVQRDVREKEMSERYESFAENMRKDLAEHINSDAYLKKLTIEFAGNSDAAKKEQQQRFENIKNVKITLQKDFADVKDEFVRTSFDKDAARKNNRVTAFYNIAGHEIFATRNDFELASSLYHELLHASTRANAGVTDNAKRILEDNYVKQGFLGMFESGNDAYTSMPTERLVSKQMIEKSLDEMGILKYGDEFTQETYEKIMKAYEVGKFTDELNNFIRRTKPGFENYKKIFENIAKNESDNNIKSV